jgi:hypothetical protein
MAGVGIVAGDLLTFRVWCTEVEQASVNTFNYLVETATGPSIDQEECAIAMDARIGPTMKIILNNNAIYNGVQCYVKRVPLPLPQASIVNAGAGTGGANAMARQTAGITRWNTFFAGQAYRGRTYWPFPATAEDATGGIPNPGYITAIGALSNSLLTLTGITAGGGSLVVSFVLKHGKNKAGVTPLPSPIQQYTAVAKWATQKRRGSYGKVNVSPI